MDFLENYKFKPYESIDGFSHSVAAVLLSVGGEAYIPHFKRHDVSIRDLAEMSDVDLVVLGVDSVLVREQLLAAKRSLPAISNADTKLPTDFASEADVVDVLKDSQKQLHRILLNLMANRISLLKCKRPEDALVQYFPSYYASDIILRCFNRNIIPRICKMEADFEACLGYKERRRRKTMFAIVGGAVVIMLSIGFVKSLKMLS